MSTKIYLNFVKTGFKYKFKLTVVWMIKKVLKLMFINKFIAATFFQTPRPSNEHIS